MISGEEVYERVIGIVDFLDLTHIGFLTGDISRGTFTQLESQLNIILD